MPVRCRRQAEPLIKFRSKRSASCDCCSEMTIPNRHDRIGHFDPERLKNRSDILVDANNLPRTPGGH